MKAESKLIKGLTLRGKPVVLGQVIGKDVKGNAITLIGWQAKRQLGLVKFTNGQKSLCDLTEEFGLVFAVPSKPPKAGTWAEMVITDHGPQPYGFASIAARYLAMAKNADQWVAFCKRWPKLAKQLDTPEQDTGVALQGE